MMAKTYKTGDKHPDHNMLAFVRYDEQGREEWTSVFRDSTAPFRLAAGNGSGSLECRRSPDRIDHSESGCAAVQHR